MRRLLSRALVVLITMPLTTGVRVWAQSEVAQTSDETSVAECRQDWDTLFQDDFEGNLNAWSIVQTSPGGTGWGLSSRRATTGSTSLYVNGASTADQYVAGQTSLIVYGPFNLSTASDAQFLFRRWIDTEPGNDILQYGASTDGVNFTFAPGASGSATTWSLDGFSVGNPPGSTPFIGRSQVWIGLRFSSNGSIQREGAYVDALCLMTRPNNFNLSSSGGPTLENPTNGSVGVMRSGATLAWSRVSGALSYDVQVSTRNDFASGSVVLFQNVNDPHIQGQRTLTIPGELNSSTTYYWRVRPRNNGGAGVFSNTFTFTTESTSTQAPSLLSPANGATNTSTTLDLTWSPVSSAASYIVEVRSTDTQGPFRSDSTSSTSITLVAPIANWSYAWRVRVAGDPQNPWSGERTFSTGSTGPLAPVPTNPPDGAQGQPTTIQFSWQAAPQAVEYRFQISRNDSFSQIVSERTVSGTSTSESGLETGETYFWRVGGIASNGDFTFSRPRQFATQDVVAGIPQLISPAHGATNVSTTVNLAWQAVLGANTYEIQVRSTDSGGAFLTRTTPATSFEFVAPIAEWNYAWRVRVAGDASNPWSTERTFTTGSSGPLAPRLLEPLDNATDVPRNVTLNWQEASEAVIYRFQISENDNFEPVLAHRLVNGTSTSESGLAPNTSYYWRVAGLSSDSAFTFTRRFRFTTGQSLGIAAPLLASPLNGATNTSTSPTLEWGSVDGADSYVVEVRASSGGPIIFEDSTASTSAAFIAPIAESAYDWRVRAAGDPLFPWSDEWSFSVGSSGPLAPEQLDPADGSDNVSRDPNFSWSAAPNAANYHFQLSDSNEFTSPLSDKIVTSTSTSESGLDLGATYYWRVAGVGPGSEFTFSRTHSFTVSNVQRPILAPSLLSPLDGQTAVSLTPTLEWTAVDAAETYLIELAEGLNFGGQTILRDSTSTTSFLVPAGILDSDSNYWWRTTARNGAGSGPASSPVAFTTYLDELTVSINRSFGPLDSQSSYRLIGMPGNVSDRISIDGEEGTDWRMFWDNGTTGSDYLVEYNQTSTFQFGPGRGFWLISESPWSVSTTLDPVELDDAGYFEIPVHQGWNIISNPFDVDVAWSTVREANGDIQDLWRWSGSYSSSSTFRSASSGEAYYFNNIAIDCEPFCNLTGNGILATLRLPYPGAVSDNSVVAEKFGHEQRIWIELVRDDEVVASVTIADNPESRTELDPHDQFAPRAAFSDVSLRFVLSDHPPLAVDARPDIMDGATFDLEAVVLGSSGWVDVDVTGIHVSGQRLAMALVDNRSGRSHSIADSPKIWLDSGTTRLTLVVGPESFVADRSAEIVPDEFSILGNYPNPFDNRTTIEYAIPSDLGGQRLTMEIFDILGRRVAVLADEVADAGLHRIEWERDPGLAPGIHFARVSVGARIDLLKLTLR